MLLSDTTTVQSILESIAQEKQWSKQDVENDLSILSRNRIVHVHDLRALSGESWAQIELLPLVKDLLRSAIDPSWPTANHHVEHQPEEENKKKKEDDSEDSKKKKNKKNKKEKKGFKSPSSLGTPVVPTILTSTRYENGNYLHDNGSDTSLISQDPLTIQNTIRNTTMMSSTSEEEDDDDEDASTPTRRKSVSFSEETAIINSKKEKKKDKKKKKDMASIEFNHATHPYTSHPIVKIQKLKFENCQKLPPVPPNDPFLQGIHDKLVCSTMIDT